MPWTVGPYVRVRSPHSLCPLTRLEASTQQGQNQQHGAFLIPFSTFSVLVDAPWCVPKGISSLLCGLVSREQGRVLVSYGME